MRPAPRRSRRTVIWSRKMLLSSIWMSSPRCPDRGIVSTLIDFLEGSGFGCEAAPMSTHKRNTGIHFGISALGHVWTAPSWQGLSSRTQHWSVQPCVRPVDAVHMTAGHNALRGSGPGQKLAFDNALALVGCPDRRIDRLCITCCLPSQHSHHIECPMRSRSRRKRSGFFVAFAPSHHRPRHPGDLVGESGHSDVSARCPVYPRSGHR